MRLFLYPHFNSPFSNPFLGKRLKSENCPVDAKPTVRFRGAILKHMPQVALALTAKNFCSQHPVAVVWFFQNGPHRDDLIKTGPSAMCIKFGMAVEQCVAAAYAMVNAVFKRGIPWTRPWPFRAFLAKDSVLFRC